MVGFRRMHEKGGGACRGQRGCNLGRNMPAFANSGDNHTALNIAENLDCFTKRLRQAVVEGRCQRQKPLAFGFQCSFGRRDNFVACGCAGHAVFVAQFIDQANDKSLSRTGILKESVNHAYLHFGKSRELQAIVSVARAAPRAIRTNAICDIQISDHLHWRCADGVDRIDVSVLVTTGRV